MQSLLTDNVGMRTPEGVGAGRPDVGTGLLCYAVFLNADSASWHLGHS